MLTNATLTWSSQSGYDRYGQPALSPQPGVWPCQVEAKRRKLMVDGREVVATQAAHLAVDPGISVGDQVTIGGVAYTVLETAVTPGTTLAHTSLALGPPAS